MHPGGTFRRSHHLGDFLVRQPFTDSKRKDLSLCRRQLADRSLQALLRFIGYHRIERIILSGRIVFLNLGPVAPPPICPAAIQHQSTSYGEQPCPERALPAKPFDRVEGSNERVLHQLVYVAPFSSAHDESSEGGRMTSDKLGRRTFIPAPPEGNELGIPLVIAAPSPPRFPNRRAVTHSCDR